MIANVFDTETTGLINSMAVPLERQPEIVQLHFTKVRLDDGLVLGKETFLFKPSRQISEEMTKIHGISNEDVASAPRFKDCADFIVNQMEFADLDIAHNAQFDVDMLNLECKRCEREMRWPRVICTVEQTYWLKGYRLSLTNLHAELFGEDFNEKHSAEGDVAALVRCCLELHKRAWLC